ncbi:MAG: discoidin domain-containing protein, partial [Deltaproteobacteria bacterium]|nr:discoidin domain-containing protein [Deltaproteobacteria bacterium]
GTTMYGYDVGIDADYDYCTAAGHSTWTALEQIEYSVSVTRATYMRGALLQPYLGRVILRASAAHDPYIGYMQGDYLQAVRNEWNANHTSADRDLVAGVSPSRIGGGLAWVGVVGGGNGYSVSQSNNGGRAGNFSITWRHEMGHNWGCGHSVGGAPEGAGLMGGNQQGRFTGCEAYVVLNHRNAKIGYLDNLGAYTSINIPPYAAMDAVSTRVGESVAIDVTGNDFDANGDTVILETYDSTTDNDADVTLSVGTGPGGRDELIYTPTIPSDSASYGVDFFHYTIIDPGGQTATGVVILKVGARELNLSTPSQGAEFVDRETTLTWTQPVPFSTTYKVFLGPDLASVVDGTADVTATDADGDDTNMEFVPAAALAAGTKYYWRVEGDDVEPFSSAVWSFMTDSAGSMITGTSIADFSTEMAPDRLAIDCINGSGLSGLAHNNNDNDMWMTNGFGPDNDPYIVIDLGDVYDIDLIREWGYNAEDNNTYFGIDEVDIYTSLNGVDFTYAETLNFGLAPTPTTSAYLGQMHGVSLPSARYIKLDIMTSQEGSIYDGTGTVAGTQDPWERGLVGLSEIRFWGTLLQGPLCVTRPTADVAPVGAPDCIVDIQDLAVFVSQWLDDGNVYP